jgi:glycosyltransferase involved in cell wall biosynthesis
MRTNPVISFCVPTYNGAKYIEETLYSIIGQEGFALTEIIINDDNSSDETVSIVKEKFSAYTNIRLYRNEYNLGMDGNFSKSTTYAHGDFIWFCGQDDILKQGTVKKFLEILKLHPNTNFVYFNYRFFSDDMKTQPQPPCLKLEKDIFFKTAEEYFETLDSPPSFLPAGIIKASFWKSRNYSIFYKTHYVQMGAWLENLNKGNIYVVASPDYIICRMPDTSWKNGDPRMLFEVFLGSLKVFHLNYISANKSIPSKLLTLKRKKYIRVYFITLFNYRNEVKDLKKSIYDDLCFIYKKNAPIFWFVYFKPLLHLPLPIYKLAYKLIQFVNRILRT